MSGGERLANESGVIVGLALDHRQAFVNALRRAGVAEPTAEAMLETKARIVAALAPVASAILLDERTAHAVRFLPAALVLPLEAQGAEELDGGRLNRLEFSAAHNVQAGAAACKLLVHYRADHPATAARQRELVSEAAEQCRSAGVALVLEPIVYRLARATDPAFDEAHGELVVSAARDLAALASGVMKMEFPGGDLCADLTAACAPLSWVLLGGGESGGEEFAHRLEAACAAGASGFMVGRAVWGVALGLEAAAQQRALSDEAVPLFERLAAIAGAHARPVYA